MSTVTHHPRRRDLGLVAWQIRYEQRAYWRNRGRGIFTFVFPLMFLVIFASLNQGQTLHSRGGIAYNDFFVPGMLAYGVITTTYVNMAIGTAILRDEGILKRMQGTPLPRWAYIAARIGSTVVIVTMMTVITLALGVIAYGVHVRASTLPGLDPDPGARHRGVHDPGDRDHPLHPQRRGGPGGGQPHRAAAHLHLEHLVPVRHDARPRSRTSPSSSPCARWPTASSTPSIPARAAAVSMARICAAC